MIRSLSFATLIGAALALAACQSPLDTDVPRIETPLTPAPKVTPSYVQTAFTTGDLRYAIVGTPNISVDTSSETMHFWIDLRMEQTNPDADTLINGFSLNLDSIEATGYPVRLGQQQGSINMDLGRGPEDVNFAEEINTGTILIEELPRKAGEPRTVEITILIEGNKGDRVPGFGEQMVLGRLRVEI